MPIRRPLIAAAVLAMLAMAPPRASADCQPADPIDQALRTAPVAFVGTVTASDGPIATIEVREVWAGDVGRTVEVRGSSDGPGFAEDDRTWTDGTTYLVLPWVDGDVLRDSWCTATTEWRPELAGLRPPGATVYGPAAPDDGPPTALLLLAAAAVIVLLIGAVAFARR
ncbi:MAG: hypothetical protein IT341_00910 [Chloroflexi bacterium]|nr:hypothetical protein [Chloroflexota bacterium]